MSSGGKRMVLNTRERIVSTDHNRLQAFADASRAEATRFLMLATSTEESNGVVVVPSATTSPLTAVILAGGLARPGFGSTTLTVDPMVLGVVAPDASPSADDSACKMIVDAGVGNTGSILASLSFTANAGPGIRVDVVECQPYPVGDSARVVSTENRDVYDPSTGTFSPVTLTKVEAGALNYRIRLGTPGSGYPGNVSGWLPIMVASVPTSATNWDGVTCWDVRPLSDDYVSGVSKHAYEVSTPRIVDASMLGSNTLKGRILGSYKYFVAGGQLPVGGVNLGGNDYGEPGWIAATTDKVWYAWACFPFGLPRWARYGASNPRQPAGFRGLLVASAKSPTGGRGTPPAVALTLPTNTGLGGTSTEAVALYAGQSVSAALKKSKGHGRGMISVEPFSSWSLTGSSPDFSATLDEASSPKVLPVGTKELLLEYSLSLDATGGSVVSGAKLMNFVFSLDGIPFHVDTKIISWTAGSFVTHNFMIRAPLKVGYPDSLLLSHALALNVTMPSLSTEPVLLDQGLTMLGFKYD